MCCDGAKSIEKSESKGIIREFKDKMQSPTGTGMIRLYEALKSQSVVGAGLCHSSNLLPFPLRNELQLIFKDKRLFVYAKCMLPCELA